MIVWAKETEELDMSEGEATANAERDARAPCDMVKR
jgi:hypothetical protein